MNQEKYNQFIDFTAKLESVAATDREKVIIDAARDMFTQCAQFESGGTAATGDVKISNGKNPDYTSGTLPHNGPKSKPRTPEQAAEYNADVDARNAQWAKQNQSMKRRVKNAEHTLEEYAELAPGELDAWVEKTLRPTIEEYLDSEEGGLVWADETKKKVKRERGAGGFITPEMKRAKFDADRKKWISDFDKAKAAKEAEAKKAAEPKKEEAPENQADAEKKPGFWDKFKGAMKYDPSRPGRVAKKVWNFAKKAFSDNVAEESIATSDLRACFESVFGNSDHLSDDAVRAICYNALDRKFR